jgi:hypothetical protein
MTEAISQAVPLRNSPLATLRARAVHYVHVLSITCTCSQAATRWPIHTAKTASQLITLTLNFVTLPRASGEDSYKYDALCETRMLLEGRKCSVKL